MSKLNLINVCFIFEKDGGLISVEFSVNVSAPDIAAKWQADILLNDMYMCTYYTAHRIISRKVASELIEKFFDKN